MTQTIFMVGARGAGKTTIGKVLAQALNYQFTDTDLFMQKTSQMTVTEVVAREGWEGFRYRESMALERVTAPKTVIATGGGAVLAEENRVFMRNHGLVIYLSAPANVLAERLAEDPDDAQRPSLTGKPIVDEMLDILASREALYQEVAHHVLDGTQSPEHVVEQVLQILSYETVK